MGSVRGKYVSLLFITLSEFSLLDSTCLIMITTKLNQIAYPSPLPIVRISKCDSYTFSYTM